MVGSPGGDVISAGPGFFIRGFTVDNLSGSWLYNPATGQYIAPYTLGFASSLRPSVTSLTLQYVAIGPGAQTSANVGKPFALTLYDSPILNAAGTPFLNPDGTTLGTVNLGSGQPLYSAMGLTIAANGLPIWALEPSASGYSPQKITFHSPSVAQTYSLYRAGGASSGGTSMIPTSLADPSTPSFSGILRYQYTAIKTTVIGALFEQSTAVSQAVIPNTVAIGDTLLFIALNYGATATIITPPGNGWVQGIISTNGVAPCVICYYKTATASDAGSTVSLTWNLSQASAGIVLALPGLVPDNFGILGSSTTTTPSFPSVAGSPSGIALGIVTDIIPSVVYTASTTPTGTVLLGQWTTSIFRIAIQQLSLFTSSPVAFGNGGWANALTSQQLVVTLGPIPTIVTPTTGLALFTTASIPISVDTIVDVSASGFVARAGAASGLVLVANTQAVTMTMDVSVQPKP
jgi:hypothetical protein